MQLNLPTTWTSQKMNALFLLILLHSLSKTEAGSQFSTCQTVFYETILKNFLNSPNKQTFCCHPYGVQCFSQNNVCGDYRSYGQCSKIGQETFCITTGHGTNSNNPAGLCGGILGNSPITSNYVSGICPNFEVVGKTINVTRTTPTFSWLCCSDSACTVPPNVVAIGANQALTGNIANTNCAAGQYSLMCFNDNGGWLCTGSVGININNLLEPMGDCVLQIAPNSNLVVSSVQLSSSLTSGTDVSGVVKSAVSSTKTVTWTPVVTVTAPTITATVTPNDSNNSGLSVGAIAGISVASGVATILGVVVTCFMCIRAWR